MQGKCKEWFKHSRRDLKWAGKSNQGYIRDCLPWFFFEAERCSNWRFGVWIAYLLLETMILLVRCSGMEGASTKTCANLYQIFSMRSWEHATVTQWFSLFSGLSMHFLKLKYQQGLQLWPHPAAELFEVFPHFSDNEWKLAKRHTTTYSCFWSNKNMMLVNVNVFK